MNEIRISFLLKLKTNIFLPNISKKQLLDKK